MAGDWIKFRKSLFGDGRVRILSARCPQGVHQCVGALVRLWCLADDYADENGVLFGYTKNGIDEILGVNGFCDAMPEDWIDLSGQWVKLPNYHAHNGHTAKRRAQDSQRKAVKRARPQPVRNPSASQPDKKRTREEKRREDINPPINPPPPSEKHATKNSIKKNTTRFVKPTTEKIRDYINEIQAEINPDEFLDFYTANGWTQGKGKPIKDWQACVRTWQRNKKNNGANGNGKNHPPCGKSFAAGDAIKTKDVISEFERNESITANS